MILIFFALTAVFGLSFIVWFNYYQGRKTPKHLLGIQLILNITSIALLSMEFSSGGIGLDYTLIGSSLGGLMSLYLLYKRLRSRSITQELTLFWTAINFTTLALLVIAVF